MRYFLIASCMVFASHALDFSTYRCFINDCGSNDEPCHQERKRILQQETIKSISEITYCFRLNMIVPGTISNLDIGTTNTCSCKANNQVTYCLPYIESPQDSSYPCSPKMLEYYDKQREIKEQKCNKFKSDWNANKYPCIFDEENVDKCREVLYYLYCK